MSFFFNDTATTEIYTLSLHDALPIFAMLNQETGLRGYLITREERFLQPYEAGVADLEDVDAQIASWTGVDAELAGRLAELTDRKSTRLNSSHANISYAVFCLKKKHTI